MCFWESINSQRFCTGSHTPHWFIRAYGSPLIGIPVQALDDHPSYKDRWRVDRPLAHMVTFWHPGLLCSDEIHKNVGRKWANWASQSFEWHGFVMDSCLVVTIMMIHNLGWPPFPVVVSSLVVLVISFPFSYWRLYTWKGMSQSIVVRSRIQRFVLLLLSVLGILLTFWFQKSFSGLCVWSWANEQHGWPFSLLNDDQMSNKIGGRSTTQFFSEQECHHCFGASDFYMNLYGQRKKTMFTASCWSHSFISCCSSKLGGSGIHWQVPTKRLGYESEGLGHTLGSCREIEFFARFNYIVVYIMV